MFKAKFCETQISFKGENKPAVRAVARIHSYIGLVFTVYKTYEHVDSNTRNKSSTKEIITIDPFELSLINTIRRGGGSLAINLKIYLDQSAYRRVFHAYRLYHKHTEPNTVHAGYDEHSGGISKQRY